MFYLYTYTCGRTNEQQEDSLQSQAIHCLQTKLFELFCLPVTLSTIEFCELSSERKNHCNKEEILTPTLIA